LGKEGLRPLIGITADYDGETGRFQVNEGYTGGIEKAGGVPAVLPPTGDFKTLEAWLGRVDGLLLTGGGDLDPVWMGEEPIEALGTIVPERDQAEIQLTRLALRKDTPILAVCRGIQVLAVAVGGSIYQDLASQKPEVLKHFQKAPRWYPTHAVELFPGSLLGRCLKGKTVTQGMLRVNSFHHQAVKEVCAPFVVTARARDGVIEAIESTTHTFVVGVQWHPEAMWDRDPAFLGLFEALVEAAARAL